MSYFEKLGIGMTGSKTTSTIIDFAKQAENGGLDSVWLAESYHHRSATSLAAAIACNTKRIRIALGIINTHTRHPGLLAMESATLAELSAGRFTLGLGTALHVMSKHRLPNEEAKPVARMRECVTSVRNLLKGEALSEQGEVFGFWSKGVRLGLRPSKVPIIVGCTGPKMLSLAGEIADGVMFDPASSLEYIRYALDIVEESAKKAGRDPSSIDSISYFIFSVDDNPDKARDAARELTGSYIARVLPIMNEKADIDEREIARLKEAFAKNDLAGLAKNVSDETLEKVAVAGNVDECRRTLAQYAKTGLKHAVLYEIFGPKPKSAIDAIVKEIYPKLVRK